MTAKEKAKELVEKMRDAVYDTTIPDGWNSSEIWEASKHCALICVYEIIKCCKYYEGDFLEDVKKEIELL